MRKTMNKLAEIFASTEAANIKCTRLYLVTRKLKDEISKNSKNTDKYQYQCWNINTDAAIQKELNNIFISKLKFISNEGKYLLANYSVITDDAEKKILAYTQKEKVKSFIHIVDEDLKNASKLDYIIDLESVRNIWAYIIELSYDNKTICGLRKMLPSKVMVAEKHILMTRFNTKEKRRRNYQLFITIYS
jgi:hypothetical protein